MAQNEGHSRGAAGSSLRDSYYPWRAEEVRDVRVRHRVHRLIRAPRASGGAPGSCRVAGRRGGANAANFQLPYPGRGFGRPGLIGELLRPGGLGDWFLDPGLRFGAVAFALNVRRPGSWGGKNPGSPGGLLGSQKHLVILLLDGRQRREPRPGCTGDA